MHYLQRTVLISSLFIFNQAASADVYQAFSTTIEIPASLSEMAASQRVQSADSLAIPSVAVPIFSQIFKQNYTAHFHPLVADFLTSVKKDQGQARFSPFMKCALSHQVSALSLSGNQASLHSLITQIQDLCQKIERPETLFATNKLFKPSLFAQNNVEDLLETVITPMEMQRVAFSGWSAPISQELRQALLRLRYDKLKAQFTRVLDAIKKTADSSSVSSANRKVLNDIFSSGRQQLGQLMQINNEGKQAYKNDENKVWQQGYFRTSLPYNNLSDQDRKLISTYVYAYMWRFRGGGFVDEPKGTQATRLHFAQIPYQLLGHFNSGTLSTEVGQDMFLRLVLKGWGQFFDMGRSPNQESEIHDLIQMTERSRYQSEGVVSILRQGGYETQALEILSLQGGLCYLYAFNHLEGILLKENLQPPFQMFIDGPTAWAEVCWGAALGLGLSETLLKGSTRPNH